MKYGRRCKKGKNSQGQKFLSKPIIKFYGFVRQAQVPLFNLYHTIWYYFGYNIEKITCLIVIFTLLSFFLSDFFWFCCSFFQPSRTTTHYLPIQRSQTSRVFSRSLPKWCFENSFTAFSASTMMRFFLAVCSIANNSDIKIISRYIIICYEEVFNILVPYNGTNVQWISFSFFCSIFLFFYCYWEISIISRNRVYYCR